MQILINTSAVLQYSTNELGLIYHISNGFSNYKSIIDGYHLCAKSKTIWLSFVSYILNKYKFTSKCC